MKSDLLLLASIMVYIQLAAQRGTTIKVCFDACSVIWFFTHCEPKSRRCLYNIFNFLKLFLVLTFEDWSSKVFSLGSITDCSWTYVYVRALPTSWAQREREIHFTQTLQDISEMEQIIQRLFLHTNRRKVRLEIIIDLLTTLNFMWRSVT